MKAVRQSDRAFGLTVSVVFIGITLINWLTGGFLGWTLVIAATFAVIAWLMPGFLMPLNRLWEWLAPRIAAVNNTVILGSVFYLVVLPIGIIMKLRRRDPMSRVIQPASDSYWTPVKRQSTAETFRDQF